ncbi:hypothetical protein D3C85_1053070 [compost metagenome]
MQVSDSNEVYVLEDGDGDPEFMHETHEVVERHEDWFDGFARGQIGKLFQILGPKHQGQYVVLTPRRMLSIEQQMADSGYASVVVNLVLNSTATYGDDPLGDVAAIGMTTLRRRVDPRFAC